MRKEKWFWIPGYRKFYKASTFGRIKSARRKRKCGRGTGVQFVPGKILKPSPSGKYGYLIVSLSKKGKTKQYYVHQLIAKTFLRPPLKGEEINHKDGNKENCRPKNIEWKTRKGNMDHAIRNGLNMICFKGQRNGHAKLTEKKVHKIRRLYKTGNFSLKDLAIKFKLRSPQTICLIVNRETWSHI